MKPIHPPISCWCHRQPHPSFVRQDIQRGNSAVDRVCIQFESSTRLRDISSPFFPFSFSLTFSTMTLGVLKKTDTRFIDVKRDLTLAFSWAFLLGWVASLGILFFAVTENSWFEAGEGGHKTGSWSHGSLLGPAATIPSQSLQSPEQYWCSFSVLQRLQSMRASSLHPGSPKPTKICSPAR